MSVRTALTLFALPAVVAIATDLGSKAIVTSSLRECTAPPVRLCDHVTLLDPIGLLVTRNPDAALGVIPGSVATTVGLAVLILLLLAQVFAVRGSRVGMVGVSLEVGGFVANTIDRGLHGDVTDFIDLRAGHADKGLVLNLADLALAAGALLFLAAISRGVTNRPAQARRRTPIEAIA